MIVPAPRPEPVDGHLDETGGEGNVRRTGVARIHRGDLTGSEIEAHATEETQEPPVALGRGEGRVSLVEGDRGGGAGEALLDHEAHRGPGLVELAERDRSKVSGHDGGLRDDVVLAGGAASGRRRVVADVRPSEDQSRIEGQEWLSGETVVEPRQDPRRLVDRPRTDLGLEELR